MRTYMCMNSKKLRSLGTFNFENTNRMNNIKPNKYARIIYN